MYSIFPLHLPSFNSVPLLTALPPYSARSANLCFSFSFFVHGESTVCASLSLRQHGPLRRLTRAHLSAAHGHGHGLPVVLAPYGLAGVLTGQTFRLATPDTRKLGGGVAPVLPDRGPAGGESTNGPRAAHARRGRGPRR